MLEPGGQDEQRATLAELLRELRQAAGLSGERKNIEISVVPQSSEVLALR